MAAAKSKEVAVNETKKEVAVASNNPLPADLASAYGTGPTGFEKDRADDFIIPFYTILQGLSPQMETVDGAKLGKIINTSSNEMLDNLNIVVVRKVVKYPEWAPNRGGLVAVHEPDSAVVKALLAEVDNDKFEKLITKEGNQVNETKYIYGVTFDDNKRPTGFATIGFSVTKIKKFNAWNTDARNKLGQFGLPLHALGWSFSSFKDKNPKGEFYNWQHGLFGGSKDAALVHPTDNKALFEAVQSLMGRDDVKLDIAGERAADGADDAM